MKSRKFYPVVFLSALLLLFSLASCGPGGGRWGPFRTVRTDRFATTLPKEFRETEESPATDDLGIVHYVFTAGEEEGTLYVDIYPHIEGGEQLVQRIADLQREAEPILNPGVTTPSILFSGSRKKAGGRISFPESRAFRTGRTGVFPTILYCPGAICFI